MKPTREQILFERALNLVANEWGYTRARALTWLNDDAQWQLPLTWPTDKPLENVAGMMPFVQVTRTSIVTPP